MVEKCLLAASLAVLVCHPSSTIKCFKPKSRTTSPHREKPPQHVKKVPSKSKKKANVQPNSSFSSTSTWSSRNHPPDLPPPILRTAKFFKAVSELVEGDPSIGVVEIIFRSGWGNETRLTIEKVLKVNHSEDVLNKFEEYRRTVKSKYADQVGSGSRMERLVVDGNELLRFHGAIITCSLGINGFSSICNKICCGVCRIITLSSSAGEESVPFYESSLKAHERVTAECVANGVRARKAVIICRVIAGRVARCPEHGLADGKDSGFDSLLGSTTDQSNDSEQLMVLNPRSVLPCFVVTYNVKNLP